MSSDQRNGVRDIPTMKALLLEQGGALVETFSRCSECHFPLLSIAHLIPALHEKYVGLCLLLSRPNWGAGL